MGVQFQGLHMAIARIVDYLAGSFRARVIFLCASIVVVVAVSFTSVYVVHESKEYREQAIADGRLLAGMLARSASPAVYAADYERLHSLLSGVLADHRIQRSAAFAADGSLLAYESQHEPAQSEIALDDDVMRNWVASNLRASNGTVVQDLARRIAIYTPVMAEAIRPVTEGVFFKDVQKEFYPVGMVLLEIDRSEINERIKTLLVYSSLFSIAFMLLGTLGAVLVSKSVLKPVTSLLEGVTLLGNGDLSWRLQNDRHDEIGSLASAFNSMAVNLQKREEESRLLKEQLLLAQEAQAKKEWERTFDTVPDLVAIVDRDHRIMRINTAMARRFGITKEEATGTHCYEIYHRSGVVCSDCICANMQTDGLERQVEYYDGALGAYFWLSVSPLRNNEGEIIGSVHVARDISDRKKEEEEKKVLYLKLIQENKMAALGFLVSGVAHEINNPNNSISFAAHMLQNYWGIFLPIIDKHCREQGDFKVGAYRYTQVRESMPSLAASIIEGNRRIDAIIKNLRDFVRKGQADLSSQVEINRVISATVMIMNHQIKKHVGDFRLDLGENLPSIRGNSQQLEQIMVNLLINAFQAVGEQGLVSVSTSFDQDAGMVVIKVADNGCGMPPAVQEHIFEPFFSTKTNAGGTGLGLAISLVIVREHGGTIEFESAEGAGTTAIVRFPAA